MNNSRRSMLKVSGAFALLVAAGVITEKQALAADGRSGFEAKSLAEAMKALGGSAAVSKDITITAPAIAENGAVVPVGVSTTIPNVQEIYILVDKNPQPLSASFMIPAGTEANVQTRLKLGQSSDVIAVVKADGKIYSATKETKVTLGGCGG